MKQECSILCKWRRQLMVLCIASVSTLSLFAQGRSVSGTVTDANGDALPGVTVSIQGTTNGTVTDADGKYRINVGSDDAVLKFSFVGYEAQTITVGDKTEISVTMAEDVNEIEEVVVIGYGSQSKRDLTASVSTVDAGKLQNVPVASVTDALGGRTAGLIVTQSGGGINNNSSVSIRGGGTPIVVLNGFIVPYDDFRNLNSEDIESMSILKDAAAAAVYGARAANGVIVVKTKTGMQGLQVEYSFNQNWSQPATMEKKLNSYEVALFDNKVREVYKLQPRWTEEEIEKFRTGSDPYNYPNTDWQKLMLRDFAPETRHTVTLKGGNETNQFYVSFQAFNQESIYTENTNNLQRYNVDINESSYIKKIGLKLDFGISGYIFNVRYPYSSYNTGGYWMTWSHIQNYGPMSLAYNEYGQLYINVDHPLVEISPESGYQKTNNKMVNGRFNAAWDVYGVKGLQLKAGGNYRLAANNYKQWLRTAPQYDLNGVQGPKQKMELYLSNSNAYQYTLQFFVDYNRAFGKHNIAATFGYEQNYSFSSDFNATRKNYVFDIDQISAGPSNSMENGGGEAEAGRAGYVGRLAYNYAKKYYIEGSIRYDGSDLFPEGKRWGAFYAGSFGYAISEESFFDFLKERDIFNLFKIRGSFGQVGLDSGVGRFAYLTSYGLNERGYVVNGNLVPTFSEGGLISPDITWYTSNVSNLGFDFTSLRGRLRGSFEYFFMKTKGYLTTPSSVYYTDPLGLSLPQVKSNGETRRAGVDMQLAWKDKAGDFTYEVGGNFTYFDQLVAVAYNEDLASQKNPYRRSVQQTGYYTLGLHNLGYYADSDDVMNSPKLNGSTNLVAGDIKYEDTNGDGKIDSADQRRIGKNSFPRGNYGIYANLGWKGFFANILFMGSTNRDFYTGDVVRGQSTGGYTMVYPFQQDYWMPDNRDAAFPRIAMNYNVNGGNNYQTSDFWIVSGRYLRLKTLQLGYNFKEKLLTRVKWISRLDLVLSGQNLLTLSPAKKYGFDPETGSDNNYAYPVPRIYSLSVNIGF